jgi:hypothetical protein
MSYLFETHPLVLSYMVPSLLSVYSDVEITDRANQFYAKFNMRQYIGEQAFIELGRKVQLPVSSGCLLLFCS